MAKNKFLLGLLVIALAFGMMVIGCDLNGDDDNNGNGNGNGNNGTDPTLNGTWVSEEAVMGIAIGEVLILNNGTFEGFIFFNEIDEKIPADKGTFTTRDGSITKQVTHVHGDFISSAVQMFFRDFELPSEWLSKNEMVTALEYFFKEMGLEDEELEAIMELLLEGDDQILGLNEAFASMTGTYELEDDTLTLTFEDNGRPVTTTYTRQQG
ncbi:MAG: hypothetical protein FWC97_10460 [Treponema sp.]|nr:hypothetical protein [Treponema sp.]